MRSGSPKKAAACYRCPARWIGVTNGCAVTVVLHVPCVFNVLAGLVSPLPLPEDVEDAENVEDAEDGAAAESQVLVGVSMHQIQDYSLESYSETPAK